MTASMIVLDGGTGRELGRIGAPFRQPEWSALALIEAPRFVSEVHRSYIAAGADVITTNSYAVVPFHIGAERFAAAGQDLARLAGRLAREAADAAARPVTVAGSLPPICGSYRAEWFDPVFARPILATLVEGLRPFIDHWQAETLSSTAEAQLVREVVGWDGKPLWLSFTLRDDPAADPGKPRLRSGQSIADAVAVARRVGAEALLFNCSQPEVMGAAVAAAVRLGAEAGNAPASEHAPATDVAPAPGAVAPLRIGVYANAFAALPKEAEANVEINDIRADLTPQGYLSWVRQWVDLGARIVGGCCGIGPEHIAAIRESVGRHGASRSN